jgi:hypothetical protein
MPKKALVAKIVTSIVLFTAIVIGFTTTSLYNHGYSLSFGWKAPRSISPPSQLEPGEGSVFNGVCDRPLIKKGFPFSESRPSASGDSCGDDTNTIAYALNFILAGAIAVGASLAGYKVVSRMRMRL